MPNGVASGKDQSTGGYSTATYEAWVTVHSNQTWSRIFDFGTTSLGEISTPGGVFTGSNYFMLSANEGGDPNLKMERSPGGGQTVGRGTALGMRMHLVTTYDTVAGAWKFYKDGILFRTVVTPNGPSTIPDVNVWLGRSNWSGDSNAEITYEEFRIHGRALSPAQVWESFRTGPDALPSTTPTAYQILVDPSPALTTGAGNLATEWNTAGNLEGWTPNQTSATVSGGTLQGTTTGNDSWVIRSNFAGPDLDLGWNDFVEVRLQVPATYNGAIQIFYGTSYNPNTDVSRQLVIPSSLIPKDGAFHTYRIDVGQVPQWRSTLRDLRIDAVDGAGSSGLPFAIDYIRVGDEPNAVAYQPVNTGTTPGAGIPSPGDAVYGAGQTVSALESKHFRFLWNNAITGLPGWTADMPHGTLRNAEEAWQVYAKKLGYREPAYTFEDPEGTGGGSRGKINITTWYTGYFAGGTWDGAGTRGWTNITPDGLRVDPPSWVLPHEAMHVFQFYNNGGGSPGSWYEGHANYGRERWIEHYQFLYPNTSGFDTVGIRFAHMIQGDGRDQYLKWTSFLYLDSNPDNLPDLGEITVANLWRQAPSGVLPFNMLDTIAPTTGKKNIFGRFAQHGVTMNYPTRPMLRNIYSWDPMVTRFQYTDLQQKPDDTSWWRVPYEMAPQQGGYTIHELAVPNPGTAGRTVSVNFRGLADGARGADWRAGFTIMRDDGTERYTDPLGNGLNSVTLGANENRLFICVAGTPNSFAFTDGDEVICPYRSHPAKTRFPYEMQVTGATPVERGAGGIFAGMVQHANGGGWKHTTANVAATAYVGPNARVYDTATVTGNARIEDFATVQNNGKVFDNAIVSGHGWVKDNATVRDNGRVRGYGVLSQDATVAINGRVTEHADVLGNTLVTDIAVVKGSARCTGGLINGNAIVDGNYEFSRNVFNGFITGHLPFVGVPDTFITPLPTGLYVSYDFGNAHDSRIIDQYGVTDSFTVGSPAWVAGDANRQGYLTFNGTNQHVNLDRSVTDMRDFSFTAWVKPAGGAANQAVLWIGSSLTKRLYFTPDDGSGQAKFSIVNGGAEQTLTTTALPVGAWTHVAITLSGMTGRLFVGGNLVASAPITIRADQLLGPDTATGLQQNYLARSQGSSMARFAGSLDNVRFYSGILQNSDVYAMAPIGTGGSFGNSGNTIEKVFDSNFTTYFDSPDVNGSWVGLDLGGGQIVTQVKYCPRPTFGARMVGGVFQASNSPNFTSGVVNLHTITSAPPDGAFTTQNISNPTAYRYVRYLGPNGSYCNVAELAFVRVSLPPSNVAAIAGLNVVELNWSMSPGATGYKVKRATVSGGPYTIVGSPTDSNYSDTTASGGTTYYYVVTAVNSGNESGNSTEMNATPLIGEKLTGTVIGSPGSWADLSNTIAKVFDGKLTTFYDAMNASGDWVGLDLGTAQTVVQVKYCPRSTLAARMVGGVFQASNSATFTSGVVTLHTITAAPVDNALTAQTIGNPGAYRYVRYLGPPNSYCDVAELEVYKAKASPPVPTGVMAVAGNNEVALEWSASPGAMSYNVRRSTVSGGSYALIASPAATAYTDTTAVNGTTYYYVVTASNAVGQSANSMQVTGTPLTPGNSWRQNWFGATENSGTAADTADPDGDGVTNLLERAFGGNPNVREHDLLPYVDDSATRITIVYRKARAATDLNVTVEEATDLAAGWSPASGSGTVLQSDETIQRITYTRAAGSDNKLFVRVKVISP